jgi:predicted nucleotidyltransferase component of viral defense system
MIRTAIQLKAKIRNLSQGDSTKAQTYIRNFMMERFLERLSLSRYRDNFILKGGMLIASIVGLALRATMDIDATVSALPLSADTAEKIVNEIIAVEVPDNIIFRITNISGIMEEHDYPGIRVMLEATLDNLRQAIKIDISTGDVITPGAIEYRYPLMFEERSIPLKSYNIETSLAEKLETIIARGVANTRMRDFYDIFLVIQQGRYDAAVVKAALAATSKARNTDSRIAGLRKILRTLETDAIIQMQWENYKADSFYVSDISWSMIVESIKLLAKEVE